MKPAVPDIRLGSKKMNLEPLLKKVLKEKDQDNRTAILRILMKLRDMAIDGDLKAAELLIDRAYGKPSHSSSAGKPTIGTIAIQYVLPDGNNNKADKKTARSVGSAEVVQ